MKRLQFLSTIFGLIIIGASTISSASDYKFARVAQNHTHMQKLMENAFLYLDPKHKIVDDLSGYPFEGWNQEPERGLFLRSFTQLTAIGKYLEILGNIACGNAKNPLTAMKKL